MATYHLLPTDFVIVLAAFVCLPFVEGGSYSGTYVYVPIGSIITFISLCVCLCCRYNRRRQLQQQVVIRNVPSTNQGYITSTTTTTMQGQTQYQYPGQYPPVVMGPNTSTGYMAGYNQPPTFSNDKPPAYEEIVKSEQQMAPTVTGSETGLPTSPPSYSHDIPNAPPPDGATGLPPPSTTTGFQPWL